MPFFPLVVRYRFRTKVKNLYPQKTMVTILDQVPVSRDQTIQVKVLEGSTPTSVPEDPSKPGVRVYKLELEAQAEKQVDLFYEVHYPLGQNIAGLE